MNEADHNPDIAAARQSAPGKRREYVPEPDARGDLCELLALPVVEALRSAPDRRPEALVAYLRARLSAGDEVTAWHVCESLLRITAPYLVRQLGKWRWIDADTREDMKQDLAIRLYDEWFGRTGEHRFWEVRFWHCMRMRLIDTLRKRNPGFALVPLADTDSASGGALPEPPARGPSVEERAVALAVLGSLPEELRRVFLMKHYERLTEDEIAQRVGVTSRTVRNMLKRARDHIDARGYREARS